MRIALSGIFLLFTLYAGAQDLAVGAGYGVSTTRMDDMKFIQEYILETYPLGGKVISSFPTYTMGSFNVVKQLYPLVRIGAGYATAATGARSNYSDYSGSINTDISANSHRLGAWLSYAFLSGEHYDLSLFGRLDLHYSRVDIKNTIYALGYSDGTLYEYKAFSPAGTAGLEGYIHIASFSIGANAGYLVDIPGKLSSKSNDADFEDPRDRTNVLTTDWTGWRAQLKVLIWLKD
jgi:hypothetical protein